VAGGCGDDDLVRSGVESAVDEFDPPAGHFADVVAAFAHAPPVGVGGGPAVAVASDVINMANRASQNGSVQLWSRNLIRWASQPSKQRRLGSPPAIGPPWPVTADGAVNRRRHHLRPWLPASSSDSSAR
jgi:hypothetical protein